MKIHLVTVGKPKLDYARRGFEEYFGRLGRLHQLRHTAIADKHAYDTKRLLDLSQGPSLCILDIGGEEYTSEKLAEFLSARELEGRELTFLIGGPEGLPQTVRDAANFSWSLGRLTLPHDLAMVVTLEALYRASTINAHLPYHK